jgi:hypothetical protein
MRSPSEAIRAVMDGMGGGNLTLPRFSSPLHNTTLLFLLAMRTETLSEMPSPDGIG